MFAATGNHVETLQRISVGALTLGDLPPGEWRVLQPEQVASILAPPNP